ncbi:MAG TPA: HAD family phosphatase, partial [Candidatus Omnitrophota bacterium]|nr:HAD family phosphatase [Candidatus Omnitrophota bacterium]
TGTSRHELHRILPDYLYNLFSVVVTGTDVKNGKPHPEPFLKALKLLKIKSSEAVVIENAPLGIQSAKKAGLRCFALASSLPKQFLHEADAVFSSIKEMRGRVGFSR